MDDLPPWWVLGLCCLVPVLLTAAAIVVVIVLRANRGATKRDGLPDDVDDRPSRGQWSHPKDE